MNIYEFIIEALEDGEDSDSLSRSIINEYGIDNLDVLNSLDHMVKILEKTLDKINKYRECS